MVTGAEYEVTGGDRRHLIAQSVLSLIEMLFRTFECSKCETRKA